MRQELEEYRSEAAHLKNQQATVRRLEERNRSLELQVRMSSVGYQMTVALISSEWRYHICPFSIPLQTSILFAIRF